MIISLELRPGQPLGLGECVVVACSAAEHSAHSSAPSARSSARTSHAVGNREREGEALPLLIGCRSNPPRSGRVISPRAASQPHPVVGRLIGFELGRHVFEGLLPAGALERLSGVVYRIMLNDTLAAGGTRPEDTWGRLL